MHERKEKQLSPMEEEMLKKLSEKNAIELDVLRKCYSLIQEATFENLTLVPEGEKAQVSAKIVEVIKVSTSMDGGKKIIRLFSKNGEFLMVSLWDFE